jgi:exopolyphosphatase/guanosine-5'-triphosphate,3'-diphosphate pyrophosphatase
MRFAVIDLGSNTIRMTVFDEENGSFRHILNEKEIIGLIGYTENGLLAEDGIIRVIETIKSFSETARAIDTGHMGCFATAGLRIIKNADEVVERVMKETGVVINTISGEEEARLDFIGAWRPEGLDEGLVIDMGGGSTEIVRYKNNIMENSISLPFGSLSLYRRFVKKITPQKKELKHIKKFVGKQLSCVDWLPDSAAHICLIGGTIRAITRLHKELYGREYEDMQGYTFKARDIPVLLDRVTGMGDEGIRLLTRVVPERIHTIIPGLVEFSQLVGIIGCDTVSISRSGVREGYLKEYLNITL